MTTPSSPSIANFASQPSPHNSLFPLLVNFEPSLIHLVTTSFHANSIENFALATESGTCSMLCVMPPAPLPPLIHPIQTYPLNLNFSPPCPLVALNLLALLKIILLI